jgi:cytochrome c oxidase subunit 4
MSRHHITPLKSLLLVAVALTVLTIITVAVRYLHLPKELAIGVALFIASIKATLVGAIFMGLYYDKKLNTIVFLSSLIFLALLVGLTLSDTLFRPVVTPTF